MNLYACERLGYVSADGLMLSRSAANPWVVPAPIGVLPELEGRLEWRVGRHSLHHAKLTRLHPRTCRGPARYSQFALRRLQAGHSHPCLAILYRRPNN